MKKLMLAFVLLLGVVVSVKAQSIYGDKVKTDVKMKYIYSFEEALKKAREVNKPIFVNCFADWAVPCHGMNQLVYSDQQFADWMDRHFVNLFIDITTNEGRPLATKYNTLQMAHYIVLDQDGNLIYRIVGGHQLPEFQELLAKALDPKTTLPEMNRRYEKGERNLKFLRAYADVLNTASEDEKAKKVIEDIFARLKDKQLPKEENWKYFMQKIRTNEDELFKKLITRKAEFVKNIGQEKVDRFISGIYFAKLFPYACGTTPYDGNLMVDLALELHKCNLPDTNGVFALYNITKYRGEKKYDKMIEAMRAGIPGCHKELAMNLDVCLGDIKGLPNQERDLLIGYLKERSKDLQRPPLSYYEQAISNLENREGVQFQDLIYEEALKKAGKEGKMVFMDCYTVWCGPCKMMNERVFTQKVVGDYFKKHFIPLKVDMEKGEGIALRKKFDVNAFPTMFILDAEGNIVGKLQGARDTDIFLKELKEILGDE